MGRIFFKIIIGVVFCLSLLNSCDEKSCYRYQYEFVDDYGVQKIIDIYRIEKGDTVLFIYLSYYTFLYYSKDFEVERIGSTCKNIDTLLNEISSKTFLFENLLAYYKDSTLLRVEKPDYLWFEYAGKGTLCKTDFEKTLYLPGLFGFIPYDNSKIIPFEFALEKAKDTVIRGINTDLITYKSKLNTSPSKTHNLFNVSISKKYKLIFEWYFTDSVGKKDVAPQVRLLSIRSIDKNFFYTLWKRIKNTKLDIPEMGYVPYEKDTAYYNVKGEMVGVPPPSCW